MVRILCIGNRFYYPDDFGIRIYEALSVMELEEIEVVEGGVGGMSLALYFEDDADLLVVDYGSCEKSLLTPADIANIKVTEFSHDSAFLYLLKSVQKEYLVYLCNERYKKGALSIYVDEILALARGMLCK